MLQRDQRARRILDAFKQRLLTFDLSVPQPAEHLGVELRVEMPEVRARIDAEIQIADRDLTRAFSGNTISRKAKSPSRGVPSDCFSKWI